MEADPGRLDAVEKRLQALRRLETKYGRPLDDLIAYHGTIEEQELRLQQQEEDLSGLEADLTAKFGRLREAAVALSQQRQRVARPWLWRHAATWPILAWLKPNSMSCWSRSCWVMIPPWRKFRTWHRPPGIDPGGEPRRGRAATAQSRFRRRVVPNHVGSQDSAGGA